MTDTSIFDPNQMPTAPRAEPVPHVVPQMHQPTMEAYRPVCWRAVLADLDDLMKMSLPTLREKWPYLTEGNLSILLRRGMVERTMAVFRTRDSVGLYEARIQYLDSRPVVEEIFHRVRPGHASAEQYRALKAELKAWSTAIGARLVRVGLDTNYSREEILRDKELSQARYMFMRLGQYDGPA